MTSRSTAVRALHVIVLCALASLPACGDDDDGRAVEVSDGTDATPDTPEDVPDDAPEVVAPNEPPSLTAPAAATIAFGHLYQGSAIATDPNLPNDVLAFEVTAAPLSLSLDRGNGRVVWSPREEDIGAHTIGLKVTDQGGLAASASFTITVVAPGAPPSLAPIADQVLMLGDTLEVPIVATDPDLPDDSLAVALALAPATSRLGPDRTSFIWTPQPSELGEHDVIIEVTDAEGRGASEHFIVRVITVNGAPVANDDLFVTPRGVTTTLTPLANDVDPDGDPLSATVITEPQYGELTDNGDGTFAYRPGSPAALPFEPVIGYRFINHPTTGAPCFIQGHSAVGDVDGDGRTEIVTRCQFSSGFGNLGSIVMLRADKATSELDLVWATHTWGNGDPDGIDDDVDYGISQPVLADLDRNGKLEIIVPSVAVGHTLVFDHTGRVLHGPTAGAAGLIRRDDSGFRTVADLDGDGFLEILSVDVLPVPGGVPVEHLIATDRTTTRLWARPLGGTVDSDESVPLVVADLDLDGRPEVIAENYVFDAEGQLRWFLPGSAFQVRTFVGVANLDGDPFGEVVVHNTSRGVEALRHDGTCLWRARPTPLNDTCPHVTAPAAGWPTGFLIADLDGEGTPEIVVASTYDVLVLDRDGAVVWHRPNLKVEDNAIQIDDMAAFDFNGDGAMEIVIVGGVGNNSTTIFGGTLFLDGRDGSTVTTLPSSGLAHPGRYGLHMLVADIDDDRSAELLITDGVGVNFAGSPTGLFVYESANAPWMPTRPVWNQWSYAVTNATTGGDVPAEPEPNWLVPGMNNFRVNVPLPEDEGGSDRFTYVASDANFESNTATVVLDIRRPNAPPFIIGTPPTVVGLGETYYAPIRATDTDLGDVVTIELAAGPEGMALGSDNALYWATTRADLGEHQVVVTASDLEGGHDLLEFTLRVVEPQPVPDVIGQQQAAATATITGADFVVGRVIRAEHPTVPAGAVMEQTPAGGSLAVPGAAIALVISTGPGPADRDQDEDTFTPNEGDCDDANAAAYPGAPDAEADGIDQDCDGIDGSRPVVSIDIEPDSLGLLVGERKPLKAWGIFADGSAQEITGAVVWSVTGAGATVEDDGAVLATAAGNATVKAARGAVSASISVSVTAGDPNDDTPPAAVISSPTEGESVFGTFTVTGIASDDNLVRYDLQLAPANTNDWTIIASGTDPVEGGTLGELDGTTLLNGAYFLRLTVLDAGGLRSYHEITVIIDGEQKVGLFTIAFDDLSIPLGGLSIDVTRTYDSRVKSVGDFGVGWDIAIRKVSVKCSAALGEGWVSAKGGWAFQLLAERAHTCSVKLPDGRVETFDFAPSPSVSVLIPFTFAAATFAPRGGSLGRLEALGNPNLIIVDPQPGPVTLFDDVDFTAYLPDRFRYTTRDETVFLLGPNGLETMTDRNGVTLTFTADGITHSSGTAVELARDSLGRITTLTDPLGNIQRYAYSASGDLVSHTDALGNVTRYHYNRDHGLLRIEDPLGRPIVRNEYDERGRLVAMTDAAGNRTSYRYDDVALTRSAILPDGTEQVTRYDARGNVLGEDFDLGDGVASTTRAYDDRGNEVMSTDADGVRQERTYEGDEETTTILDPGGLALKTELVYEGSQVVERIDPAGRTTKYAYDGRGNAILETGPGGQTVAISYDDSGEIAAIARGDEESRRTYDAAGRISAAQTRSPDGASVRRVEYVYDDNGRPIEETRVGDGVRLTTRYAYDAAGNVVRETDAAGGEWSHVYDAAGQRTSTTDPLGNMVAWVYDDRGNVVETRHPDGGIERFDYDWAGNLLRHESPSGVVTEHVFDGLGREVETRVAGAMVARLVLSPAGRVLWEEDGAGDVKRFEYDTAGRLVRLYEPERRGPDGALITPRTTYELDRLDRRVASIDPLGERTEFLYDAADNPAGVRFADGSERLERYDEARRIVGRTDEAGNETVYLQGPNGIERVTDPSGATMRYSYDAFGRLRSRTDALGRTVAYTYDALDRLEREVRADGRARVYGYDSVGRVTSIADGDTSMTFTYDAMGRLTERRAGDLVERATYTASGLRATSTSAGGTTRYGYDARDRLTSITHPDGAVLAYTYDGADRVLTMKAGDDVTTYGYSGGVLESVAGREGTATYRIDAAGRMVGLTLPNAFERTSTYDGKGRALDIVYRRAGAELARFAATYDARGKRLGVTELDGSREAFSYDDNGRLVSAKRTGTAAYDLAFEYDAVGNRVRETRDGRAITYRYGPNDELVERDGVTFDYDARGNRITGVVEGEETTYDWDAFGRLVGVGRAAGASTFGYDLDDRRVREGDVDLVHDRMSPTGYDQVVQERRAGSVVATTRIGREPLARVAAATTWFGQDAHGSVRLASDDAGSVVEQLAYEPFGRPLDPDASGRLFAGERYDRALGAYDLRARSYDPASGTFLSRDPFSGLTERPFSLHRYQYADADPVNLKDPSGLFTTIDLSAASSVWSTINTSRVVTYAGRLCKVQGVTQFFELLQKSVELTVFLWNLGNGYGFKYVLTWERGDKKYTLDWNPYIKESRDLSGGLRTNYGWKLTASAKTPPTSKALSVEFFNGKLSLAGALELELFSVSFCSKKLASLTIGGKKTLLGKGSDYLELAVKFEKAVTKNSRVEPGKAVLFRYPDTWKWLQSQP